jgi:cell wall-associated NlpC family hydrolase
VAFDDEFLGPLAASLSGTLQRDPTDEWDPVNQTWDMWDDKRWLLHERSDNALPSTSPRPQQRPSYQPNETIPGNADANRWSREHGVEPTDPDMDLMTLARSQIGAPYVWADANPVGSAGGPGSGFDCSGFTQWVLGHFGITTPHISSGQQDQFRKVGRDELQPGDLVFYHYTDRNGGGDTADHVEMYIGNGQTIGSSGGGVMVRDVNWDAFVGGGATGIDAGSVTAEPAKDGGKRNKKTPVFNTDPSLVPLTLAGSGRDALPTIMADMFVGEARGRTAPDGQRNKTFKGPNARINEQLYRGFMDAGKPGIARMVGTPAFTAWISQESGYDPHITSPANNNGLANDGLFQIWRGHDFNSNGQVSRMSPYEQAQLVAEHFDLTVSDIERYYDQIQSDTYAGWG